MVEGNNVVNYNAKWDVASGTYYIYSMCKRPMCPCKMKGTTAP
jgi:hypothetical protein